MIHIRAVSPPDTTPRLVASLERNSGVLNLIVLQGVVRNPDGDAVQFDVINAQANEVVLELRTLGVDRGGSIVIEDVGTELSDRVTRAEARVPRALNFSPIWEEAEARIRAGGRYPPSWFVLLAIAGLIAAVGIFTNSQILIVGAMVVGPEYAAIISVALGINTNDRGRVRSGSGALFFGFLLAIVATFVFGLVVRAFGWEPEAFSLGVRPVSDLIDSPNVFPSWWPRWPESSVSCRSSRPAPGPSLACSSRSPRSRRQRTSACRVRSRTGVKHAARSLSCC